MVKKIVFLGKTGIGKTQLINRMADANAKFEPASRPTIGVDFRSRRTNKNDSIQLWDLAGNERYEGLSGSYLRGTDIGVFCVDLTEEIDEPYIAYIKGKVETFREANPDAPIILVETKAESPHKNFAGIEKIKSMGLFTGFMPTSAKNNTGIEELFSYLTQVLFSVQKDKEAKQPLWGEAVATLKESLKDLPEDKTALIQNELARLTDLLSAAPGTVSPQTKADAIEAFTTNCEAILEGNYSNALKAVLTVAAVAVVTLVAGLIGFGIGFALGWWSGPGAFFSGIATGHAAATLAASSILGVVAGGICAYGLFKTSKEMTAVNEFTASLNTESYLPR